MSDTITPQVIDFIESHGLHVDPKAGNRFLGYIPWRKHKEGYRENLTLTHSSTEVSLRDLATGDTWESFAEFETREAKEAKKAAQTTAKATAGTSTAPDMAEEPPAQPNRVKQPSAQNGIALCADCVRKIDCEHEPDQDGKCEAHETPQQQAASEKRRTLWASVVPSLFSAKGEQAADLPPRVWFIAFMITVGLTIISARKGLGKTFLALQMAIAITAGALFLGFRTEHAKVLYIALELDRIAMHERLLRFPALADGLDVVYDWPRGVKGLELLKAAVIEGRYGVIYVDMIAGILPPDAETNSYDLSPFLADLRHIALDNGVAIVALHHSIKGDSGDPVSNLMGSTAFGAQADSIITIERKRGEPGTKIYVNGNHGQERTIRARFDDCRWIPEGEIDDAPHIPESDGAVLRVLEAHLEGIAASVLAATVGKAPNSIRASLSRLAERGLAVKRERLWYPRTAPHKSAQGAFSAIDLPGLEPHEAHESAQGAQSALDTSERERTAPHGAPMGPCVRALCAEYQEKDKSIEGEAEKPAVQLRGTRRMRPARETGAEEIHGAALHSLQGHRIVPIPEPELQSDPAWLEADHPGLA